MSEALTVTTSVWIAAGAAAVAVVLILVGAAYRKTWWIGQIVTAVLIVLAGVWMLALVSSLRARAKLTNLIAIDED